MRVPRYRFVDVTPKGYEAVARDINEQGAILVDVCNPWLLYGMVWRDDSVLKLEHAGDGQNWHVAMNDEGLVVGGVDFGTDGVPYACRWIEGRADLLDSPENGRAGEAVDVNKHGIIVGLHEKEPDSCVHVPTFWFGDRFTDFVPDFLPYEYALNSEALGINDRGVIVGTVAFVGFIKERDEFRKIEGSDQHSITPWRINRDGVVIGRVTAPSEEYAFRYRGDDVESLGTLAGLSSHAWDINDAGVIVGDSTFDVDRNDSHGFVYIGDRMYDLNDLVTNLDRYVITTAQAINNKGQIAADAKLDGKSRALLLTPTE